MCVCVCVIEICRGGLQERGGRERKERDKKREGRMQNGLGCVKIRERERERGCRCFWRSLIFSYSLIPPQFHDDNMASSHYVHHSSILLHTYYTCIILPLLMAAASLPCLLHFCSLLLYQKQFITRTVAHGMLKTQVYIYIYIYPSL